MKNVRMTLWLAVAAIIVTTKTGMANADSFEPDNLSAEAKPITTNGQAQSHSINPAADIDWLIFTLEVTSKVTIETNGISGDTVMSLYNSQISELLSDDDGGNGSFSLIQTTLPAGAYYVKIREYNDKALIEEYYVSVTASPVEIVSIIPNSAPKGESLTVTIIGQNAAFLQGTSTITNVWLSKGGTAIDANSFTGIDATTLEASFNIPANALVGKWDINVEDSIDGLLTLNDGFMVYTNPDLNGDGKVDNEDLALLSKHWLGVVDPNVTALNAALSGLEVIKNWCSESNPIDGSIATDQLFAPFFDALPINCPAKAVYDSETGYLVKINIGSADEPITLPNSAKFYADFTSDGSDGIIVTITGQSGQLTRKIRFRFVYGESILPYSVFDFGIATKGPLALKGGILSGASVRSEADVYIESLNDPYALGLLLSSSEIVGVAKIVNPNAVITAADIKGKVGGLSGQEAIDQTIEVGVTPIAFPYPDAVHFKQYATGGNYISGSTLTNQIIPAGKGTAQKPLKFTGNTTINGILYIESPNVIDFGGNITVHGMIVAEGDVSDNSGTNKLSFTGSVDSNDLLAPEKGTFLMAPGFALVFTGSLGTIKGTIAGSGIIFDGNASGTIKSTVINYSTTKMEVNGSSNIIFNRSGVTDTPSGFVNYCDWIVYAAPESYEEIDL